MPAPGEDDKLAEQRLRDAREVCLKEGDSVGVFCLSRRILTIIRGRGDMAAYTREAEFFVALMEQNSPGPLQLAAAKLTLGRHYLA